jgi:hypothetical protein
MILTQDCSQSQYSTDTNFCKQMKEEHRLLIKSTQQNWNKVGTEMARFCNMGDGTDNILGKYDPALGTVTTFRELTSEAVEYITIPRNWVRTPRYRPVSSSCGTQTRSIMTSPS